MTNFYETNGVIAWLSTPDHGLPSASVADEHFRKYRVTFSASEDGTIHVSISAAVFDRPNSPLGSFTNEEPAASWLQPEDEVSMSDEGLLTVMKRVPGASFVDFRSGFTMLLPREYVEPIRLAITKARELAAALNEALQLAAYKEEFGTAP